jgi:hypothetical protein
MKIFLGHSSNFDYVKKLYEPLKGSTLFSEHEFVLPRDGRDLVVTKEILQECDLYIGDVSTPSTGEGIELGWCDLLTIPHHCIYEEGSEVSKAIYYVTDQLYSYKNSEELIELLTKLIRDAEIKNV